MTDALLLSRIRLRPDPDVRALAPLLLPDDPSARPHAAHRLIWSLFADTADRQRDFLWRDDGQGRYFALSHRPPHDRTGLFLIETTSFAPALERGDRLGFSLRANPVIQRRTAAGRPRRDDVVMAALYDASPVERAQRRQILIQEAGSAWLAGQGQRAGFSLPVPPRADGYDSIRIPRADGAKPMIFSTLDFEGLLVVHDPSAFVQKLIVGFGRARGFGCGLMLIRRA